MTGKVNSELVISVLNGLAGDYLHTSGNALSIDMACYHKGCLVDLSRDIASQVSSPLTNRVVVLVHGLTNLETVWQFPSAPDEQASMDARDYGSLLQTEFGFTPFYLRYNTGLSIEENGRQFSRLLEQLNASYPQQIEDLMLIGFSMGGLVQRVAQAVAKHEGARWLTRLRQCFYLGTPHEGAPLERIGHLTSAVLASVPREYISHWSKWIDVRSTGIQDLRYGLKYDEGLGEFYPQAKHCFISGAMFKSEAEWLNKVFGDSLVQVDSACPGSAPADSDRVFIEGIAHVPLAHSRRVFSVIRARYLAEAGRYAACREVTMGSGNKSCAPASRLKAKPVPLSAWMDLALGVYDATVDTVELLQDSIADESYSVLTKIPPTKPVAELTQQVHKGVNKRVFAALRATSKAIRHSVLRDKAP